ncbi:hypothetical protein SAMN04515647_3651 [Cohaesibacter sp. ES.047]|uniref:hypothetical protein n=1 Tax=Cohaesibacter sp. ES.047 TaxID=1798205 RepID=UPI000BC0EA05|nr:hypothetical protein [Cohaesibacter sp. ES.047]SNY93356.1 hypothetical protein SAMN04515647_3651 [Cohaesibacter sp. ES.047]
MHGNGMGFGMGFGFGFGGIVMWLVLIIGILVIAALIKYQLKSLCFSHKRLRLSKVWAC